MRNKQKLKGEVERENRETGNRGIGTELIT
jgi:hypothetical protein